MLTRFTSVLITVNVMMFGSSFSAWAQGAQDFDSGCIAVVIDDDNSIINAASTVDMTVATQRFFQTHGDDYDIVQFFPDFATTNGTFYRPIENSVIGLGNFGAWATTFNNRATYNAVVRLHGITHYKNNLNWPANLEARIGANNDSPLSLIGQETAHRWGAFVRHATGDNSIIGRQNGHWSYYLQATSTGPRNGASSLEGNAWVDNGDGTFTTVSQTDGFSELDQYLMGLRAPGGVSPFFYIDNPTGGLGKSKTATPGSPDTVSGTRVNVSINDIIATKLARVPSAADAPKNFRHAFVLLAKGGTVPTAANITRLDGIRQAWETYFAEETNLLGSVDGCILGRALDVVFLVDISGSFDDDLPVFQAGVRPLLDDILATNPGSRFALASFSDFPFAPHGSFAAGDIAYRLDLPLTEEGNLNLFDDAVDALTILNALDLPQSQYEALFQVMTGAGRDLSGNGNFTDIGDIAPTNIGAAPDTPMFIFLFTDADFHDPDVEPDYPFMGATSAGRADVLAELTNTPFIFGLVSGDGDNAAMQEVVDVSDGEVFVLAEDSLGFDLAALEAVETTTPPPAANLSVLSSMTVTRAQVEWKGEKATRIDLRSDIELPSGSDFSQLDPIGHVSIFLAETPIANIALVFAIDPAEPNVWRAKDGPDSSGHSVTINWSTPTSGRLHLRNRFVDDSEVLPLKGDSTPAELAVELSLGEEMLSKGILVAEGDWTKLKRNLWLLPQTRE